MFHHTLGIWICQEIFGRTIRIGKNDIPVRLIAERHILEDLGWLPSPADYIKAGMELAPWMSGSQRTHVPLSAILGEGNGSTKDFVGSTDSR